MDLNKIQRRHCPACDAADFVTVDRYSQSQWPLVSCTNCDFVFLNYTPNDEAFEEDLAWEKSWAEEEKQRKKNWIYKIDHASRIRLKLGNALDRRFFMHNMPSGGRVLDVGCGGGSPISEGAVPFGIEISKGLATLADPLYRKRGGYVVNSSAADGLAEFADDFFDHAILRSYLEHESRPRLVLERLYQKLKSGGIATVKVPDYQCIGRRVMGKKWCGFRFPDHQNYFTRKSLRSLAGSVGLNCKIANLLPGINDNIYAVLVKPMKKAR